MKDLREKLRKAIQEHNDNQHGGLADKKSPSEFDFEQLLKGVEVELEHTDTLAISLEISMDHLAEDPKYYDHLEKMEEKFSKKENIIFKLSNKEFDVFSAELDMSQPEYSMDRFQPGTVVMFLIKGKPVKKKVLYTDKERGRVVVDMDGKAIGVPESQVKIVDEQQRGFADIPLPSGNFPRTYQSIFNLKTAKKKDKWNPNPWAVCHTTVDKDENPAKHERCVKKVKSKQKKEKKSINIFNLRKLKFSLQQPNTEQSGWMNRNSGGVSPEDIQAQASLWEQIKTIFGQIKSNPQQAAQSIGQLEQALAVFMSKLKGFQASITAPNGQSSYPDSDPAFGQIISLLNQMKQNPQQFGQYLQQVEVALNNIESKLRQSKMI